MEPIPSVAVIRTRDIILLPLFRLCRLFPNSQAKIYRSLDLLPQRAIIFGSSNHMPVRAPIRLAKKYAHHRGTFLLLARSIVAGHELPPHRPGQMPGRNPPDRPANRYRSLDPLNPAGDISLGIQYSGNIPGAAP